MRRCGRGSSGGDATGPCASTVAVHELRAKGPIVHAVWEQSERVGTHGESYGYGCRCAEGLAAECEQGLVPAGSSRVGAGRSTDRIYWGRPALSSRRAVDRVLAKSGRVKSGMQGRDTRPVPGPPFITHPGRVWSRLAHAPAATHLAHAPHHAPAAAARSAGVRARGRRTGTPRAWEISGEISGDT